MPEPLQRPESQAAAPQQPVDRPRPLLSWRLAGLSDLIDPAPVAAVDATALETRHVGAYFSLRRGGEGHRERARPKLTAGFNAHSHLILGAALGVGPSQDSPDLTSALLQAAGLVQIDMALGDAATMVSTTASVARISACGRRVIRFDRRNPGRRWPKTPYRCVMRHRFPRATYNQRWHAESGFSQHKRRLGSALTARNDHAQARELVLRILTHNLMLLTEAA